jgi:hypothetical protein
MRAIVCVAQEVEVRVDRRTRRGSELEAVEQVRRFGGFTVFWATDDMRRARALERLSDRGVIVRLRRQPRPFPWCAYRLGRQRCRGIAR